MENILQQGEQSKLTAKAFALAGEDSTFVLFEVERLSDENDLLEQLTKEVNLNYQKKLNMTKMTTSSNNTQPSLVNGSGISPHRIIEVNFSIIV